MDKHIKFLILLSILFIAGSFSLLYAQEYQPLEDIGTTAQDYIIEKIPKEYTIESLKTGRIDSRIKLKKCDKKLTANISGIFKINKHFTVGVRCEHPLWTYYVPIKAVISAPLVVAKTTILRDEYISPDMLQVVHQQITGQHQRYFKNISDIAGKQAKRTIKINKAITASQLKARYLVKRKQVVLIVAKNSRLMVKMKGIALSNGKHNDRIKVRNKNSNKIVEGVVSAVGVVTVNF